MERLVRVAALWSWLPAFRAVAETENVHEAARGLGVSPSSLSRTIRLLEEELERPLFERGGGGFRLTVLGRELLAVTRDAMRAIDDATAIREGLLRIAAPRDLTAGILVPALRSLDLVAARVTSDPDVDPVGRLLRGELDLVLSCVEMTERHILCDPVAQVRIGIYVASAATVDEAAHRPFVSYRSPGGAVDRWPADSDCAVALELDDPTDAALAAAEGSFAVALPDPFAARMYLPLRRLPVDPCGPVTLFAIRRRSLGPVHPADALVAALRAAAADSVEPKR